jgi:hypothetical protein
MLLIVATITPRSMARLVVNVVIEQTRVIVHNVIPIIGIWIQISMGATHAIRHAFPASNLSMVTVVAAMVKFFIIIRQA